MPDTHHVSETPNDPSTGGGRATPGIDHGRFAPGSGRPRERDAPSSPGVGHTPGIATTPGSPGWGMTPGTSGHFLLQIGKTEQKQSKNNKKTFFRDLPTSLDRVSGDTLKTVFFAFGIIYLFWPSDDAYFLLHQSKRYSILFLLRT